MNPRDIGPFTATDHATWRMLYDRLCECRKRLAHPLFLQGLATLHITGDGIPHLTEVNARLREATGWQGVPVRGLEGPKEFFASLARREFPVGNFIRSASDLNYTPAPDVFHDLYGHLPMLADPEYAAFCAAFGRAAMGFADDPARLRQFERVFWFGVEFPLIETEHGRRIFGGGILSSRGESYYAMSDVPEVRRFDWNELRRREFKIDEMQNTLYVLQTPAQLYTCVGPLAAAVMA